MFLSQSLELFLGYLSGPLFPHISALHVQCRCNIFMYFSYHLKFQSSLNRKTPNGEAVSHWIRSDSWQELLLVPFMPNPPCSGPRCSLSGKNSLSSSLVGILYDLLFGWQYRHCIIFPNSSGLRFRGWCYAYQERSLEMRFKPLLGFFLWIWFFGTCFQDMACFYAS